MGNKLIGASLGILAAGSMIYGISHAKVRSDAINQVMQEYAQYQEKDNALVEMAKPYIKESRVLKEHNIPLPSRLEKTLENISEDMLNNLRVLQERDQKITYLNKEHRTNDVRAMGGLAGSIILGLLALYSVGNRRKEY